MARDDREHTFEKALARHLRADKPASSTAAAHPCADAEILAAYHERELPSEQMTVWKEHLSSCSRCQETLAHLQATDEISIDVAPAGQKKALAPAEQKSPVLQFSKSRRSRHWLWLAPAGAIAAGFLVWIASEQRLKPIELAKNQQSIPLSPAVPPSEAAPKQQKSLASNVREDAISPTRVPSSEHRSISGAQRSAETKTQAPSAQPPKDHRDDNALHAFDRTPPALESPQPVAGVLGKLSNRLEESNKKQGAPAPIPPPLASQSVEVSAQAVEVAPQAPAQPAPQEFAKAKTTPSAPEPESQRSQQLQQMEGMSRSRFSDTGMVLLAKTKSPVVIATLNKKVSWRVGRAGSIERTDDAGATWSVQRSGVVNDLLAGSAPSDSVCWVVGQLGTILRTTDSGATWTKLASPMAEDIRSVFAVSAQQATILTAHATYQTLDGGATWSKLAPE
jgi:Photosynthesis system II assembly factor YCF48